MKKIVIASLLLFALSCGTTKNIADKQPVLASACPNNGECNFEIIKGSSLSIKKDGTGRPYYILEANPEKNVVKYTYNLKKVSTNQDDFYTEEVIFETDSIFSNLSSVKMLFGVKCYCKGKAGYYHVKNGSAAYNGNTLSVTIPPEIIEGQIINNYTIQFK